jgi:NAD+ diphosphatase
MSAPANANAARDRPYLQLRTEQRAPPDWLRAARSDPQTRVLVARGTTQLIRYQPQAQIVFVSLEQPVIAALDESRLLLLGWFEGQRCVLADLPPELALELPGTRFEELRPLLAQLREEEVRLLCYARALLVWRSRHRFCGVCGAATAPRSAGHVLACTSPSCAAEFFPRIDPAIIVLVTSGSKALLGRQKSWPPGRYSTLAGFVEAGETLEEAVAREVEEETGVQVEAVRYFASQPWPFPASLMLGFHAQGPQTPVRLDGELEDARWFDRSELQSTSGPTLPQPHTIARRLIDHWLATPPG